MTSTTIVRPPNGALRAALRLAAAFAALKLALQFALTLWTQHLGYGYFRDEFYYIACGRHLAWGYVDHGPIVAVQARLGEILFGDSLFAIRILSACAGAVTVFLTGLLAWALGGRKAAQALAMFAVLCCPEYIALHGFLSMNSFEPLFWSSCLLALVLLQSGRSPAICWVIFGVSAGVGLLNKPSMAFFLVAIGLGLLCTPQRRLLFSRWAMLGIALLLLLSLPNVFWQIHHQWPTLEFLRNGRAEHKNTILNPAQFLLAQLLAMQPVAAFVWVAGVVALLRAKSIPAFRWLGFTYLFFLLIMYALHAKDYYLVGIYPALFAAGGIAWEHRFTRSNPERRDTLFAFPVYELVLLITSVIILPMASPVFRPAAWIRYAAATHLRPKDTETEATGPLPQFFADRFGWEEELASVNSAFQSLSAQDQARVGILCANYGEAGALDFLAPLHHISLPKAISGHNNYYLWGPGSATGEVMIIVSTISESDLHENYAAVTLVRDLNTPYAMPFERRSHVYIARHRREPLNSTTWKDFKHYF